MITLPPSRCNVGETRVADDAVYSVHTCYKVMYRYHTQELVFHVLDFNPHLVYMFVNDIVMAFQKT